MSKEIRLALDLDGVLFDFNSAFISLARERHTDCKIPDAGPQFPTEWDYMEKYLSKPACRKLWEEIIDSVVFWEDLPIYEWSEELLIRALAADKLYFITSRSGLDVQGQTARALHRLAYAHNDMTGAVIAVNKPEHKIPIISALNCTHFVDDKPETINQAFNECFNTDIAMWNAPWNQHFNGYPIVPRLKTPEEFSQWLQ